MITILKTKTRNMFYSVLVTIILFLLCVVTNLFNIVEVTGHGDLRTFTTTYEKQTLVQVYNDLNGRFWINKWDLTTDPCADEWYGVTCDELGHITELVLYKNNLLGILSQDFTTLHYLEYLDLSDNTLLSTFIDPSSLTNLVTCKISKNRLVGEIPIGFSKLKKLKLLDISYNSFNNDLPDDVLYLSEGQSCKLEYTGFNG